MLCNFSIKFLNFTVQVIEYLKPECLNIKKKKKKKKKQTLEDWLLASPSMNPESIKGGELIVSKQFFKRVHSFSSMEAHEGVFSKERRR